MTTTIECPQSSMMDILSSEIVEGMKVEEADDTTFMLLASEDYRLLLSCSELMYSVYNKISGKRKNNFIIYPYPTVLV